MHGVKRSWSGTAIVPRDNESNSHNHRILILSASIRTFYEWIIFSALKKLMDIRWIANLRSSAWKLSWLWNSQSEIRSTIWVWRVEYENLALNFFVIRGDMCPNGFYAHEKRSQSDRCTVAFSNIAMFQYFNIFGVVSFHWFATEISAQ